MRLSQITLLSLFPLLISGCGTMPWHLKPESRSEVQESITSKFVMDQTGEQVQAQWWKEFNSEELNKLIEQADKQNLDIASAWARLREAAALAKRTGAAERPSLDLSSSASTRVDHTKNDKDSSNSFSLGLSGAYEIDLWGRLNAATQSDDSSFKASQFDLITTKDITAKQVATNWINIKTNQMQLALLKQQLKTNNDRLQFLKKRQFKGQSALVDILQQQQQVASVESSIPPIKETIQLQKNQLALLLGISASELLEISVSPLPELPVLPGTGLPSQLLINRPDIQSAWSTLEASDWDLTAARADRLPTLQLTAGVSTTSPEISDLFDNWAENLAASIAAPLIDGGRRKAEVARIEAQVDRNIADYKATVLEAVKEVDDALVSEKYQQLYLNKVRAERDYADKTLTETSRRYRKGIDGYLSVLIAINTKHQKERTYITAQGQLLNQRVNLYKALASNIKETKNQEN